MVEIDVVTKFTKTANAEVRQRLEQPIAVARATAVHIRRRMKRGHTATRPKPYSTKPTAGSRKNPKYYISPAYADKLGLDQTIWRSSAEMHAAVGAKAGSGNVTGAMWNGVQVSNYGRSAAIIKFTRVSLGGSSRIERIRRKVKGSYVVSAGPDGKLRAKQVTELSRDKKGEVKLTKKPRNVSNAAKASALYRESRVGALQPTQFESAAQVAAIGHAAGGMIIHAFGGGVLEGSTRAGDRKLFSAIVREMR